MRLKGASSCWFFAPLPGNNLPGIKTKILEVGWNKKYGGKKGIFLEYGADQVRE